MNTKQKPSSGALLLKADDATRTVTVAFAQLEVVDHDGDVTEPGAFVPGQKVKMCQTGHAHGKLPAGAGEILGEQDIDGAKWAVARMQFLDTDAGEQHYQTVKQLHELGHTQEWSYGYDILSSAPGQADGRPVQILKALSVYEISPVLRGAGIGTHTLGVKAKDGACAECGQALPKSANPFADDEEDAEEDGDAAKNLPDDACADCSKSPTDCACDKDPEAATDAKRRTLDLLTTFEVTRAKALGVHIE